MTEKRFSTNGYYIYDHFHDGEKWLVNEVEANEIVDIMNNLDCKARERSKALSKLQKENNELTEENQDLKSFNKDLAENLSTCANARISKDNRIERLEEENNRIKQLIHTMLVQIEVDKINTENVRYWAGIVFTFEEFRKIKEIWKGDV